MQESRRTSGEEFTCIHSVSRERAHGDEDLDRPNSKSRKNWTWCDAYTVS